MDDGETRTTTIWDAVNGEALLELPGEMVASPGAFSPDGEMIVTRSDLRTSSVNGSRWSASEITATFNIRDVRTGRRLFSTEATTGEGGLFAQFVPAVDGAPRDQYTVFVSAERGDSFFWHFRTAGRSTLDARMVTGVEFSPDGGRMVTSNERGQWGIGKNARLWNVPRAEQLTTVDDRLNVVSTAFSPVGDLFVTACVDGVARLWHARSGTRVGLFSGHESSINTARFSPDGLRVVTASEDGTARVWDTVSGRQLSVLQHDDDVRSAYFIADGRRLLTVSGYRIRIWDIDGDGQ